MSICENLICTEQPQRILSSLILCRILMNITESFSDEKILLPLCVQYYEEKQQCHEYEIIASNLTTFQ